MPMPQYPTYEFVIVNKDGLMYNGCVYGDSRDWSTLGNIHTPVFKYSEAGAHKKIATFPEMFKGCRVEKITR